MKKSFYLVLILLAALTLRLYIAFATYELPSDDGLEYDMLASNILKGAGYAGQNGLLTSFRPPLYPGMLAVIYAAFGHSYLAVRTVQALLGTLTVFLVYLIGKSLYSARVGMLAALFTAIYPSYIMLTKFLFTETLFTFLLVLSAYLLIKACSFSFSGSAVTLGLALGALSLTRSTAALLTGVYILILLLSAKKGYIKRAAYFSCLMFISFLLVIAPWAYRNTVIHNRFVLISSNGGLNFYQAVCPKEGRIFGLVPDDKNIRESEKITNEAERDKFLFSKGMETIALNPVRAAKLALVRTLFYWGFFDWEVQKGNEYNFIYGFMLPFFIFGCAAGFRLGKKFWIPAGIILYFSLLVLVSQGAVRYRLPTDGLLFIIAAYGISTIMERSKQKLLAFLGMAIYFCANCFIFVNSESAKAFLAGLARRWGLW